ncbi:hypothetical protein PFISCL1PPCAC_4470 [Pristionchus fissidentatus]|uniref:G protein-coupled receptor n=1 Tax=Pristionchus fissidentatus TaxID=1538716 RepID=A0AAV5V2B0_9BILA|nr:hypothetical protein PFISCL1PPCAC_4470 [Pristionchus fissidentatus]
MIHSGSLVALSYWYRLRILGESGAFGRTKLQFLCFLVFVPHIFHIAGYVSTVSGRELLEPIVDQYYHDGFASGFGLIGYVDISELLPCIISSYLVVFPIIANIYVFWARKKLMSMLDAKKEHMSERSHSSHKSLAKALTIHAIFPIFNMTCMAILCTAQINFGLHSKEIEGLAFDLAAVPVLVNPLLTLYFVRPYQV